MSELKVASCFEFEKVLSGRSNKLFYSKSEADKVIADLEKRIKFLQVTAICNDCNKCADGMGKVFDETLNELKAQKAQALAGTCREI